MKKDLVKFYNEYKLIIFPLVVTISGLILIVFVIYPQLTNLLNNRKEQQSIQEKLTVLEVKADELETLSREDLKQSLNLALLALPVEKDYPAIIALLQQMVAQHNFGLLALQFNNNSPSKGGKSFLVDLQLTGPKANMNSLLEDFETASRVMKIFKIDSTSSTEGPDFVNANVTLEVFFEPLPQSIGAVDAPIPQLTDKDLETLNKLSTLQVSTAIDSTNLLPRGKANPFE